MAMKTQLSVLAVSAMILASAGLVPSYAETHPSIVEPIIVATDKASYADGEVISVSGQVRDLLAGVQIGLKVVAPNGNVLQVAQLAVADDRTYTAMVTAGGPSWKSEGTYMITVQYGSQSRTAETSFEFGGSTGIVQPTPDSTAPATSPTMFDIDAGDAGTFQVGYMITGGSINSINVDGDTNTLEVGITATDDGMLTISLPRAVIDAKMGGGCSGDDDTFFVLVDDEEQIFTEDKDANMRTLTIEFGAGAESIEIIGSCAVPEFGAIAALILAAAVVSVIAVSARSRLSIMPRY